MAHTAQSPIGKVLEAIWYWIDNDSALDAFLVAQKSKVHKFKLFDGTVVPKGNVFASETPALVMDIEPITDIRQDTGSFMSGCSPSGHMQVLLWGYHNTLEFDLMNLFCSKVARALLRGLPTLFSSVAGGLLQGADQILSSARFDRVTPGGVWIGGDGAGRPSYNHPQLSYFHIVLDLQLASIY